MQKSAIVFVLGMLAGAAVLGVAIGQTTSAQFRAVNHIGIVVVEVAVRSRVVATQGDGGLAGPEPAVERRARFS